MTGDESLRDLLAEATGINFRLLDKVAFARSVGEMMVRRGYTVREEYEAALLGSADERQQLIEKLAIPETWFFRDRGPFEYLKEWARNFPGGFVRVLSAPCSTGEEPYSIAISLLEAGLRPDHFSVDAVDISQRAVEAGVRAVYRKSSFREPLEGYRHYFTETEKAFALSPEVARLVRFRQDNLMNPSFLREQEPYQVVFCRNLLIYLMDEARRKLLNTVGRLLAPDGLLVVGASELSAFIQMGYSAVPHPYSFACRKGPAKSPPPPPPVSRPLQRETAAPLADPLSGPVREASLDAAWLLANAGELEQAAEVCDRLLVREPARPEHYYLKGLLSEALGQLEAAEDSFRKTLYLDPDHYPALLQMSTLCQRRGEHSKSALFRTRARRIAERGVESHELHR